MTNNGATNKQPLKKKRTVRSTMIKYRHGNMSTDREDVLEIWKEYAEELYSDVRGDKPNYGEIDPEVNETVYNVQFGFRKGVGNRDATFMLRTEIESAFEKQIDLFMCFVDFEKAFDRVNYALLVERLRELGVHLANSRVLTDLY